MRVSPPNVSLVGDTVEIRIDGATPPVRCRVRHHDGGETQELNVQSMRRGTFAEFTPDRPGRWWVGVRSNDDFKEMPFWVKQRRS